MNRDPRRTSRAPRSQAGGISLRQLLKNPTREDAAAVMAEGATQIVTDLAAQGRIHGIVAWAARRARP